MAKLGIQYGYIGDGVSYISILDAQFTHSNSLIKYL